MASRHCSHTMPTARAGSSSATSSRARSAAVRWDAAGLAGSGGNPPGSRSKRVRPLASVRSTSVSVNQYGPMAVMGRP